jgi:hypothetical protein
MNPRIHWLVAPPLSASLERGDPRRGRAAIDRAPRPYGKRPPSGHRPPHARTTRIHYTARHTE